MPDKILTSGEVARGCTLLDEATVDRLREESRQSGVDFYTHVAATILQCEPDRVSNVARNEAKAALFMFQYGTSAAKLAKESRKLKASELVR